MGFTSGSLIDLLIVDRLEGVVAVAGTTVVFFGVTGVVCNLLCMKLDRHFCYWGGPEHSVEFIVTGAIMSVAGGALAGWLLFSKRGTGPELVAVPREGSSGHDS